jgi:hypothetical protein
MRLMGSPRRMPSMTGYGLEITGYITRKRFGKRSAALIKETICLAQTKAKPTDAA